MLAGATFISSATVCFMPPKTTSAGVIMINGDQHRFLTGRPNKWWWWGWGLKLCRSYLIDPHRPSSNLDNRKLQVSHGSSSSTSICTILVGGDYFASSFHQCNSACPAWLAFYPTLNDCAGCVAFFTTTAVSHDENSLQHRSMSCKCSTRFH